MMKSLTIILSVLLLYGCSDFRLSEKYQLTASQDGNVYRLDKTSGEVWLLKGNTMQKVLVEPEDITKRKVYNSTTGQFEVPQRIMSREEFEAYQKKMRKERPIEKRLAGESIPDYLKRTGQKLPDPLGIR
jgi:hypothetical protein